MFGLRTRETKSTSTSMPDRSGRSSSSTTQSIRGDRRDRDLDPMRHTELPESDSQGSKTLVPLQSGLGRHRSIYEED
jgi:hypothetical protein